MTKAGYGSLGVWAKLKQKFPYLVCPCSINNKRVVVQETIGDNSAIVTLFDSPSTMTVVVWDDLKPIRRQ